ncbi:hypothetical protein BDV39DRAFT_51863 [Aspergillus sergii]|uniref:Uncharacterized protein n=1 Tax=Aspergillus sergii TaxID=1034303 RepID=A0A5N6XMH6_9EURO|nr:hypothetical protein BDV39DRAFT_51863 [Aspergillus sergii]
MTGRSLAFFCWTCGFWSLIYSWRRKKEPNAFSVAVNTVIDCGVDLLSWPFDSREILRGTDYANFDPLRFVYQIYHPGFLARSTQQPGPFNAC